jgi:hypothetical protein
MQLNILSSRLTEKYFLVSKWCLSCTDLLLWKSVRSLFYQYSTNMSKRRLNLPHDATCNMIELSEEKTDLSDISWEVKTKLYL